MEFDTFAECVRGTPALGKTHSRGSGIAGGLLTNVLECLGRYAEGQPFTDDLAAVAVFRQVEP